MNIARILLTATLCLAAADAAHAGKYTGVKTSSRLYTEPDASATGGITAEVATRGDPIVQVVAVSPDRPRTHCYGADTDEYTFTFRGLPPGLYDLVVICERRWYEGLSLMRRGEENTLEREDLAAIDTTLARAVPFFDVKELHRIEGTHGQAAKARGVVTYLRTGETGTTLESGISGAVFSGQLRSYRLLLLEEVGIGWQIAMTRELYRQEVMGDDPEGVLRCYYRPYLSRIRVADAIKDLGTLNLRSDKGNDEKGELLAMAQIEFIEGPYSGKVVELPDEGILIGRGTDCNLTLPDAQVSTEHAQLAIGDRGWSISDLGSSNGTSVNGNPIEQLPLSEGDRVAIGETTFVFHADSAGAPAPTQTPPGAEEAATEPAAPPEPAAQPTPVDAQASQDDLQLVRSMSELTDRIRNEVGTLVVGQRKVLDEVLMCMIAGGHALLIGLPGLAKTLMISTIAKVVDLNFKRIQFTPDLMPSDITGTEILETNRETQEKEFRFLRGPIFCNLLLADEINRTPPKTQAALLEAMQEKRVTVGNQTYGLDAPFFVLATQNPIEQEGTYPLPEAQMDRFMFNILVDYPSESEEELIIASTTVGKQAEPQRVLTQDDVLQLQTVVRKIPVSDHVIKYAIRLVRSTRPADERAPDFIKEFISTGAGPRAGQYLVLAAKARAVLEGRIHVGISDVREAAIPVLRHRIYPNFAADSEGLSGMDIINRLLDSVDEPSESDYGVEAATA